MTVDLIRRYSELGGLLGISRSILRRLPDIEKKELSKYEEIFTDIWKKAFPGTRVERIEVQNIPRFFAIFHAIYARARRETRERLRPYLEEFERQYELFKSARIPFVDFRRALQSIIDRGRNIVPDRYEDYLVFLRDLHEWVGRACYEYKIREEKFYDYFTEEYNLIFKMIKIVVDLSTEYVGGARKPPGNFEFAIGVFVHIENFIHEFSKDLDSGIFRAYLMYLLKLMHALAVKVDYHIVFPPDYGGGAVGEWDVGRIELPFDVTERDLPYKISEYLKARAAQLGIDVTDWTADLSKIDHTNKTFTDEFPAYFVILDYYRQVVRRELKANLPWDFFKFPISFVADKFT